MCDRTETLVFDTGPLSHFAQQGWLGILRLIVGSRIAVVPDAVVAELRAGIHGRPHLQLVLDAVWIEQRELTGHDELDELANFAELLVADGRNRGEAAGLAYARANGATVIIDDGVARTVRRRNSTVCLVGEPSASCASRSVRAT
jgi:predicted nucleic acid-binding protein